MRSKFLAAGLVLIAMLVLLPKNSRAVAVHAFECKTCHIAGVSFTDLTAQVCRQCHNRPTQTHTFSNLTQVTPASGFLSQDASDWYGHGVAGGFETSHNWAAPTDKVPAAGAQAPSTSIPGFYSRYGTSTGKVTCTRCHNPHGDGATNPKLYPAGITSTDQLCTACHVAFNVNNPNGLMTHPVGVVYDSAAAGFKPIDNGANGGVSLDASNKVTCSTCHGVHFTDSDASTADVYGVTGGDGLMLKHNGPSKENPAVGDSLCQACHTYQGHGMASNPIGCMVCHGGHVYDAGGSPNYFMLNKQITLNVDPNTGADISASPLTVNLDYSADPATMTNYDNGTGVNGAVCLSCHALPGGHNSTDPCASCHAHDQATGSFGAGCGFCHGYAPYLNTDGNTTLGGTFGGYAHSNLTPSHDYSTSGVLKDESLTPHASHANGAGKYTYGCENCHGVGAGSPSSGTHDQGTFQNVLDKAGIALPALPTNNGGLAPIYDTAGSGTCSAVYCHSNGDPLGGTIQTFSVTWAGQKDSIIGTGTECQQCHGNDAATMLTKGNSAGHQKHLGGATANAILDRTYSCAVCHSSTASSSTALVASAIGGVHVDGAKDVVSDLSAAGLTGTITYVSGGTCQNVYCHSDGNGNYKTPDWTTADNATMTRCTMCHNNGTDDGVVANAAPNTGAHLRHVKDADGPQLACDVCHPAGSANGTQAEHINGTKDTLANLEATVCDACHGATSGVTTGNDREPIWTDSASVDCQTCHAGVLAVIGGNTAPDKTSADSTGHNKASGTYTVSGNTAAAKACLDCHSGAADTLHLDGTSGNTTRLQGGFSCDTCHGSTGTATKNNIVTHQSKACNVCHDPHGTSNVYMVRTTSAGNFSGTVAFTATTGTDSYDEADAANGDDICATCHTATTHNRADATGLAHHEGEDCFTCHLPHTNSPSAFAVGGGDSCDSCHGYPPATGAHLLHAPDSAALDTAGKVYRDATNGYADVSACTYCHQDADKYTYNPSTDQGSGYNHSNATNRPAHMATVGYNSGTATCASACHDGASGVTAAWSDASLACDACHYESLTPTSATNNADTNTLTGTHSTHFDAGAVCTDCHGTLPADTSHIDVRTGADEISKVQNMANAVSWEATLSATALGSTGVDPTAAGSNATCNNTACHNPSNSTYSAEWTVANAAGCDFCHSSTDPATGSHSEHLAASVQTTFGKTVGCADCHDTLPVSNAHRNGSVDFAPAIDYNNLVAGACSTSTCHNDGTAAATPVTSPQWGTPSATACGTCHEATPTSNKHSEHLGNTNYVTSGCATCHTSETAATHINGTRNMANNVSSYTAGTGSCANSCHDISANTWTTAKTAGLDLACADCHASTGSLGQGGWPASSNAHTAHLGSNALPGTAQNDCYACHDTTVDNTGALKAAGTHLNLTAGDLAFNAGFGYEGVAAGRAAGSGGTTTCSTVLCHDGVTTPTWGAGTISCGDCHGTAGNAAPTDNAAGSHAAHTTSNSDCANCHANAGSYTATGGVSTHQDLTVDIGVGFTYTDADGAAGVNYSGDGVDDGTCANACHGVTSPYWGNAGSVTCGSCHGTAGTYGDARDGAPPKDLAGGSNPAKVGKHAVHLAVSQRLTGNYCSLCHDAAGSGTSKHGDGTVDFAFNAAAGGTATFNGAATPPTCSGLDSTNCHATGTAQWDPAATLNCTDCHATGGAGSPAVSSTSSHVDADGSGTTYAAGTCTDCHSGHATTTLNAGEVNIPTTYGGGTAVPTMTDNTGTALYGDHGNAIRLGGSVASGASEAQICWGCHDTQTPVVSEWGTNTEADTGNLTYDYGDLYTAADTGTTKTSNWTTGFWRSGKGRASGGTTNPFWYKRGAIQSTHTANPAVTDAALTGSAYKYTETRNAVTDIRCSYCHDVHGTHVGINGDTSGSTATTGPYLRGTWRGNPYPEDGAPQWGMTNWALQNNGTEGYGKVPRGSASSSNSGLSGVSNAGGWWIDQNSGDPNSGATADGTSGLCENCHGDGDGSWLTTGGAANNELGSIDQTTAGVEANSGLWVSGYNGHANVVLDGPGPGTAGSVERQGDATHYGRNLFTRRHRGSATAWSRDDSSANAPLRDMGVATEGSRGYTYRSNSRSLMYYPRAGGSSDSGTGDSQGPYAEEYFAWNTSFYTDTGVRTSTFAAGTSELEVGNRTTTFASTSDTETNYYDAQANYHTFNCGKCHNPHASRLPKLMITNCLDTNHNTWDDRFFSSASAPYNNDTSGLPSPWTNATHSNWSTAQNCHRVDQRASEATSNTTRGAGWNKVTPWLDPNRNATTNPNP